MRSVAGVWVLAEKLAEHGGEPVGALHMRQVPAVREQRQPPRGQAVHRGVGLVGRENVVTRPPDDQGWLHHGVEFVE